MDRNVLTDRLELRWLTEDDADLMLAIWNDPDFIRNVGDRGIRTPQAALTAMRDGVLALYRSHGYGPYRIAARDGGAPMGICGLFKREQFEHPDIGYGLLPAYRGRGIALEAARAVMAQARDRLGLERVNAIVTPSNGASIRLLEKLGMQQQGPVRMPDDDADILLFSVASLQ
ncbi:MAG: GNAT family N-acetyltransferase [Xanthomonadales bacterium]